MVEIPIDLDCFGTDSLANVDCVAATIETMRRVVPRIHGFDDDGLSTLLANGRGALETCDRRRVHGIFADALDVIANDNGKQMAIQAIGHIAAFPDRFNKTFVV